ncbi:hypothetical protein BCR43DRAFT_527319 [Syncephalastrum racemosum]|uniref:Uncharacterized protein n=1 Tax=Syncephalastrum racemosum TaxID=13706 RepID=A0A1X2H3R4_SYNRA|nr:hypothetical protein BCR43DRAFT_527319 [Syncephalastrum racemosum]
MKEDDRAFLSANMANYQARYERLLRGLKASNFQVLGYARKSPHHLQPQALRANLGNMIACLRTRSLVDRVYVAPNTSAKSPIASRDMDRNGELLLELGLEDYLLMHLAITTAKVCLVFVDYAALSTKADDVRDFIKNHDVVKYVIIDRMQDTDRYEVYNRTQMLGAEVCSKFDSRSMDDITLLYGLVTIICELLSVRGVYAEDTTEAASLYLII